MSTGWVTSSEIKRNRHRLCLSLQVIANEVGGGEDNE